MKRTTVMAALTAVGLVVSTVARAQAPRDHLQCFKIKDSLKAATYTAELSPDNPYFPGIEPGCKIRLPAVQLCIDVAKTNVTPVPPGSTPGLPGQTYLCYMAKCSRFATTFATTDQFGAHQVAVKSTRLLCAPVSGSCTDEIQNGTETGPDCGGSCPSHCANGIGCVVNGDCQSGSCNAGTCGPATTPSCTDGIKNGGETDKDCGGSCPACPLAAGCAVNSDCQSGVCDVTCKPAAPPPSCTDGIKNGGETDKDCGGGCPACPLAAGCAVNSDCQSGVCDVTCKPAAPPPSCTDGIKNGGETDKDCGGSCPACPLAAGCAVNGDCQSGVCDVTCKPAAPPPSCTDGIKNGGETDKDCGGSCTSFLQCADGLGCVVNGDCQSGICGGNICLPNAAPPPSCTDGIKNGGETDKDCGGSCTSFLQCADGLGCVVNSDCQSGICGGNICLPNAAPPPPPNCLDGIQDGDETGKDCGGSCTSSLQCADGLGCVVNSDCQSGICGGNICLPNAAPPPPPNCLDGIQDGDETGKDCGGSCTSSLQCADGLGCVVNSDCQSGICGGNICLPNAAPPPPPNCLDGIQDGDETGKDCGGSCTSSLQCADGLGCVVNSDCQSGICGGNVCLPNAAPPPPAAPPPAP